MTPLVAHSEQTVKADVRHKRREVFSGVGYNPLMRMRIKEMRQARGWTVDVLASKVGMSRSYVSEIENGKKAVNDRRISAFAKAFGVSPLDLIDDQTLDAELMRHVHRLRKMKPEDRLAVLRHALALPIETPEGD